MIGHNYNFERLRKLEGYLIPQARIELIEHSRSPDKAKYELRLHEFTLEAQERRAKHTRASMDNTVWLEGETPLGVSD